MIVVVVRDEVLDGIVGEERLELRIELCCEGLIVAKHKGGLAEAGDDVGRGERLPRARDPEERLEGDTRLEAVDEFVDGLRLVSRGAEA